MKNRRKHELVEQVEIVDAGAEGVSIAKPDNKVVFIPYGAPGDVVDIVYYKKKKNYFEGKIQLFHKKSDKRTTPLCSHFGLCGGCKWQHLDYEWQLHYKQKQVKDSLERIAKVPFPELKTILRSDDSFYYRNKLEYTFSNRKWLTDGAPRGTKNEDELKGLGFHLTGMFDRILDVEHCYLQRDPSNAIRLFVRDLGIELQLSFYDVRQHQGLMRNLIVRTATTGDVMAVLVIAEEDERITQIVLPTIAKRFPEITSLMYVVNSKKNDTISDLPVKLFSGLPYITEKMKSPVNGQADVVYRIGPVSFYQTNPVQAEKLYQTAFDFASFKGDELVYDLYTGTGTIANYIAKSVKKVVGIEYVEEAVADARLNAELNGIENTLFYAGDMAKLLDDAFVSDNGTPEVVITDPPRAGMHEKVLDQLLSIGAPKIVYISCNPASQARDIAMLSKKYTVEAVQPVDMFPQTHHVENVVLLQLKPVECR
jgi:23S rRNA (uracil1939-C5)-methyltransferase